MGTTPMGKRPNNDITISRSTTAKSVDPVTGKSTIAGPGATPPVPAMPERSFAQPSPVVSPKVINPKAHGSEKDQKEAVEKNLKAKKQLPKVDDVVSDPVADDTVVEQGGANNV